MRITKLQLQNFKRFTDLTIDAIPASAKLVLLIGSNGSGKSCVLDAFEAVNSVGKRESPAIDYYSKSIGNEVNVELNSAMGGNYRVDLSFPHRNASVLVDRFTIVGKNHFYGRTSFRQVPRLTRTKLGERAVNYFNDTDRPRFFIERDERFENDIEKITGIILNEFFHTTTPNEKIKEKWIEPINTALANVFGPGLTNGLRLSKIVPPLDGKVAQVTFTKGNSEFHYNQLSAGEKEVFNIFIDLLVRREHFQDTIYFFDEIDLHLNTAIQSRLLKEIVENWIPDNCQFWTASHSLGFIDYARHSDQAAIVNLDDLDFDAPQVLLPELKENLDLYEIAVPKTILFELMKGKRLVICENKDDAYYNLLSIPNTVFVGVNNSRDVFLSVKRDSRYHGLRDRDFLSDSEIELIEKQFPNLHILRYYCFENYLYHPDNIAELNPSNFSKPEYLDEIRRQKSAKINYILPTLISSRLTYEEFRTADKLQAKDTNSIVDDFSSDDFERFYKYFDMKNSFDRNYLSAMNLTREKLVKTAWFKTKIEQILDAH